MKQILNFIKANYISLCITLLLILLTWLRGPELTIANFSPMQSEEQRLCVIVLILLGLFLKYIFIDTHNKKMDEMKSSLETEKKIQHLYGKFHGAIAFLKKTIIHKHEKNVNLLRLPWYLVIGPTGSGKSTLLANAHIKYILAKQGKADHPKPASSGDVCDWWVTRDLVLVDIPGNYLVSKTTSSYPLLWKNLLKLTKKFRGKQNGLQGIVLAVNLPEIIKLQRADKLQLVQDIKKRVHELLALFGKQLPIHIVVTKCDLLPGFLEFFSDYSADETAQAWGITIPKLSENESLLDVFIHRFNVLIKRLNKQVITRLHQERNPNARPYIKDFPLQIERLKEGITQLLKALALPNTSLQGVYLTSGTQPIKEEAISPSFTIEAPHTQALQILSTPSMPVRSFFVRQLILHHFLAVAHPQAHKSQVKSTWQRRLIYTTSIGAIITATIFLGRDFQQGVQQAYSIQNDLSQYQLRIEKANQKSDRLTEALPLLNALQHASNLEKDRFSFYSNKSQQTAKTVYQQALQTLVIPEIKNYFEKYLQNPAEQQTENLYPVLEAYLMLGDKEHFQADFVAKILKQLMPDHVSKDTISALSSHVHEALINTTHLSAKLNQPLIESVRKQLFSLSNTDLGFVILKHTDNNNSVIDIGLNTQHNQAYAFINQAIVTQLPTLFTANAFEKTFQTDINQAAKDVLIGNWILGFNPTPPDDLAINDLTAQLQRQYVTKYVDIWESMLANIQLHTPKNLAELNKMLASLTDNGSPLLRILATIKQQTAFAPVLAASPPLQNLNVLLQEGGANQSSGLYGFFVGLKQLQTYLLSFINEPEPANVIFAATAKRVQGVNADDAIQQVHLIGDQCPEPIKSWLHTIATQTWHFMLQESAQTIEAAWQSNVMTTYHAAIENRYPFKQSAEQEIDLQHFTQFLGQTGTLTHFYQTYLKPFVNDTGKIKQWRFTDGARIALTDTILNHYDHIQRLQRAFFPNGDNTLYVPFTLQPIALDKTMKGFTLNINGQEVRFQKNMPRLITWPGNHPVQLTAVNFVAANDQLLSQSIKGSWAWFKLVNKATETIRTRKEIALTFDIDGHKAKYLLLTQGHLNPFLPLNLAGFALPDHIQG